MHMSDKFSNKDEVVVKVTLNKMLFALIGRNELVEAWWSSPNKGFNSKTPDEVYQSGPDGRKEVARYIFNAYGGK